jgi:hypothetical protein
MRAMICKCEQCRLTKMRTQKRTRRQTYEVRAARHKVKQMVKAGEFDTLPEKIKVDYYA